MGTSDRRDIDVLGLFPSTAHAFGGVQQSAADAWDGMAARAGRDRVRRLLYEAGSSKAMAVLRVARMRARPKVVLVWHIHLLKLLPAVDLSRASVQVFLHGIEVWQKLDAVTEWLLRRVDVFVCNSQHTWDRFCSFNPAWAGKRHVVVPLGTGVPLTDAPAPDSTPAVLMLARLDKREDYKGHREVLAAWPEVLASEPRAKLWIVGDGDLRDELEAIARQTAIAKSVTFFGKVTIEERDRLLMSCRCLAMPSRGEGFGLVYLEAMRVGRPCLVSTVDAGREVVNPPEAGIAVDIEDVDATAAALVDLTRDGARWETWSANARARYEREFTAAHFQQRLADAIYGGTTVASVAETLSNATA